MNSIMKYNEKSFNSYLESLRAVGSLSALFSDSDIPLLHYRATENIYCTTFGAENLARSDVSADATIGDIGIGIKTFIENNKNTYQKIAEFNQQQSSYEKLSNKEKIGTIAFLRNKRIEFTMKAYGLSKMVYHCIVRSKKRLNLFEEEMKLIDINNIKITKTNGHIISFTDGLGQYKFNSSKSTLYKKFITDNYFGTIEVYILSNPLEAVNEIKKPTLSLFESKEFIILPLYSKNSKNEKKVYSKSGLNQWNANGRKRNVDEVYIPFPAKIRKAYNTFFPNKNFSFTVKLPNKEILSMKLCQENSTSIMSNPNQDLGHWLLRDVLNLEEGTLVTYDMLNDIGIDSVLLEKNTKSQDYNLNFKKAGSYEKFLDRIFSDVKIE